MANTLYKGDLAEVSFGKETGLRIDGKTSQANWVHTSVSGNTSLLTLKTASLYHYLGHQNALKKQKTVKENLSFWAEFHGNGASRISTTDILEAAGIGGLEDMKTVALSSGQQRRLALTRLIVAPRPIWLLDEPLTGLDDNGKDWLTDMARSHLAQNGLIIAASHEPLAFTTHNLNIGGAKR